MALGLVAQEINPAAFENISLADDAVELTIYTGINGSVIAKVGGTAREGNDIGADRRFIEKLEGLAIGERVVETNDRVDGAGRDVVDKDSAFDWFDLRVGAYEGDTAVVDN